MGGRGSSGSGGSGPGGNGGKGGKGSLTGGSGSSGGSAGGSAGGGGGGKGTGSAGTGGVTGGQGGNGKGGSSGAGPTTQPEIPEHEILAKATSVDQIASYLENKWGIDVTTFRNPDFSQPNFNGWGLTPKTLSVESARQFAQAVDDMLTKYPFLKLLELKGGYFGNTKKGAESSYAHAQGEHYWDPTAGRFRWRGVGAYITINAPMASDGDRKRMAMISKNGYSDNRYENGNKEYQARPVYWTMIHELGHIMDFNGGTGTTGPTNQTRSRELVEDALDQKFRESAEYAALFPGSSPSPGQFRQAFNKWISTRLVSAYSYKESDRDKGMFTTEAIAEAFADVELRGDKAEELSKLIHKIIIEEARRRRAEIANGG
ncbi:hypothetical protein PBI_TOAKA_2 [Mycobacterium phage Toaka]|nr:hypothetical protein PBI_TOAKA_2 [Mycobacterium phage Toaka]